MNIGRLAWFGLAGICLALTPPAPAQPAFNSGSTGADGILDVTTLTILDVPPNGIFNFTTVTVRAGRTLRFNRNVLNTPVHILATGDIRIDGTIDVSGQSGTSSPPVAGAGGPGGFDGGTPGILGVAPGAGQGPGAGLGGTPSPPYENSSAGSAAYGSRTNHVTDKDGEVYGSALLVPLVGGSGGGGTSGQPGRGGAGGGGAILLSSNTKVEVFGTIRARGGDNDGTSGSLVSGGQGSGGAIRCVAPVVSGTGTLDVRGGRTSWTNTEGGAGRIRIDTIYRSQLAFDYQPTTVVSIGSYMASFATPQPRLDIISVAGRAILEGTGEAVSIFMPLGSSASQTITLQARDFVPQGNIPVRIQLTPQDGDPVVYDTTINMSQGNPATRDVEVAIPQNTLTFIHAWTR
ncbi:hypothetical protein HS125_10615 [bacterium]|nr:hypothetical protein [bacterium]